LHATVKVENFVLLKFSLISLLGNHREDIHNIQNIKLLDYNIPTIW